MQLRLRGRALRHLFASLIKWSDLKIENKSKTLDRKKLKDHIDIPIIIFPIDYCESM